MALPSDAAGNENGLISEQMLRRRISASDLVYAQPVTRSEEGMPIGNG
jgi:hypothetical protein